MQAPTAQLPVRLQGVITVPLTKPAASVSIQLVKLDKKEGLLGREPIVIAKDSRAPGKTWWVKGYHLCRICGDTRLEGQGTVWALTLGRRTTLLVRASVKNQIHLNSHCLYQLMDSGALPPPPSEHHCKDSLGRPGD